jgi:hypothetical protein
MNNVRHISIYNQLNYQSSTAGGVDSTFFVTRNLSTIDLIKSKKYKISNLSIDIGFVFNDFDDIKFLNFGFPLRFFLDDNPLGNEYDRLIGLYPSGNIYLNNNLITSNNLGKPTSMDIVDSSNVFNDSVIGRFYNTFKIITNNPDYRILLQFGKTQTVAEYNFYNFFNSKILNAGITTINSNTSNNDISDFYFDSKTFDYLCFTIFPFIEYLPLAPPAYLNIMKLDYTVNFDLEELN